MIKVILPDQTLWNEPLAMFVPIHRRGIDSDWFSKRAAAPELGHKFNPVDCDSNHSLIHLIAMGASDTYGYNRNGDGFFKRARAFDLPEGDWKTQRLADGTVHTKSAETFADRTIVGLLDTYPSFEKNAKVFKHHKNKQSRGDKVYGEVKAAAYNEPMERVELLIKVPNNEWEAELQKLASDQPIPFSMACTTGDALVLTEQGYRPISTIAVGTLVLTGRGNWKPVIAALSRKYTGTVYKIYVEGFPFPLVLTDKHPMLASVCTSVPGDEKPQVSNHADWVCTEHLNPNDQLMQLHPSDWPGIQTTESAHLAAALGEVVSGVDTSTETKKNLKHLLGRGRDLYPGMFGADIEVRLAFLGAVFDGLNGLVSDEGMIWMDADVPLVLAVRDLLTSVGVHCTLSKAVLQSKKDGDVNCTCIHVGPSCIPLFFDYCSRARDYCEEKQQRAEAEEPVHDLYRRVNIEKVEAENVRDLYVFNLEVADDHSYVLGGFVSHNCYLKNGDICSVCGHRAHKRDHYCKHLTDNLTAMDKTGHIVGAINDDLTFFDISRVNRPADRIAWSLVKTASDLVRGADLVNSEEFAYLKLLDSLPVTDSVVADKRALFDKCAAMEKRIPAMARLASLGGSVAGRDKRLQSLADKHDKAAHLFTALADSDICLPFEGFNQLLFGNNQKIAALTESASAYLPRLFEVLAPNREQIARSTAYDPERPALISAGMQKLAGALYSDYSLRRSVAEERLIHGTVSGKQVQQKVASMGDPSPEEKQLLLQYAMYKVAFLNDRQKNNMREFSYFLPLAVLQNNV